MQLFSPQISQFLKNLNLDQEDDIAIVPKTKSCGGLGDFLIFRYRVGVGPGSVQQRLGMIVRPIIKLPKTGNLLLTVVKVPLDQELTSLDLINLYRDRRAQLPEDDYRTYILRKIYGPLYRLRVI
jgi:hypothetical protein